MMSWVADNSFRWYHKFCIRVLKCGPVPEHIAIVMDGNRRYASKEKVQKVVGHSKGFDKLAETLLWCSEMGVKEVTVYAFSIENFKRTREEVETLMQLATDKFKRLLQETEKLNSSGLCIRVVGNLNLISEDLRKIMAQAVLATKDNNKAFLNIAFAYTSRDEILHSIKLIKEGIQKNEITTDDITEDLISSCMYTNKSPNPHSLIRTSGEVRFSDFLLWQISNTYIVFSNVLWPEFSFWHFCMYIFQYQRQNSEMLLIGKKISANNYPNERVRSFLSNLECDRFNQIEYYANA